MESLEKMVQMLVKSQYFENSRLLEYFLVYLWRRETRKIGNGLQDYENCTTQKYLKEAAPA